MRLLAIDPGLRGGVALFYDGTMAESGAMPLYKTKLCPGSRTKPLVDVAALHRVVREGRVDAVVTEYQTAMPKQSSVATGTSMLNWGLVLSLRSLVPVHVVHPRVWKNHYGLGKDKAAAIAKARELFRQLGTNVPSDGEAEAMLLGLYWLNGGLERERAYVGKQKHRPKRRKRKAARNGRRLPSGSARRHSTAPLPAPDVASR